MVVAMAALFVALSGAAYAATLGKNSVSAKQIKANAVRAAEIKDGAVGANEIPDGALTGADVQNESLKSADVDGLASGDIADESLNGGDVEDGTLGSGDITDESLTGGDIADGSLGGGDVADESIGSGDVSGLAAGDFASGELPPGSAFARVQANATLQPDIAGFPPQAQTRILVSEGEAAAAVGTYCFDVPFRPASAMVSLDNADTAAADRNLVTSVAIDRGEDLGDCPANRNDARVRIVDAATEAGQDARFFIWFIQ